MKINAVIRYLGCILWLSISQYLAAQPISQITTSTANLIMNSAGKVTMSIIPKTNLVAGNIATGTPLASFNITAPEGNLIWRYTPNSGTIIWPFGESQEPANTITLTGQNNSQDTLTIYLILNNRIGIVPLAGEGNWIIATTTSSAISGTILTINPNGYSESEQVNADTYVLSIDAAIWSN